MTLGDLKHYSRGYIKVVSVNDTDEILIDGLTSKHNVFFDIPIVDFRPSLYVVDSGCTQGAVAFIECRIRKSDFEKRGD